MSKRKECRNCGAQLRHDKTKDQYDPEYCSGKCRKGDGAEPYVKTAAEQEAVIVAVSISAPASLADYKKNVGGKYTLRADPEKLNWGVHMEPEQLTQAGFRANREPIPGDWDYEGESVEVVPEEVEEAELGDTRIGEDGQPEVFVAIVPNAWQALRAEAKELGISTHGKKKEQLTKEVEEARNA
jgi:hypothetical protein